VEIRRPTEVDGLAIVSLVLGIASFVVFPFFLLGPLAMYMGHRADTRIRQSGGTVGGAGLALAGRILGAVAFTIGLLLLALALALVSATSVRTHWTHVQALPAQQVQSVSVHAGP
jgi:uncharacterized protein DUF4190